LHNNILFEQTQTTNAKKKFEINKQLHCTLIALTSIVHHSLFWAFMTRFPTERECAMTSEQMTIGCKLRDCQQLCNVAVRAFGNFIESGWEKVWQFLMPPINSTQLLSISTASNEFDFWSLLQEKRLLSASNESFRAA
jgi:hypothetical protein